MKNSDLIRQLQEFPPDMEVVVGHPRHDRCEQINAGEPEVTTAFKYRHGPWVEQWIVKDAKPQDVSGDEEYVRTMVIE